MIRILLGATFFYAGAISIRSPDEFADSIAAYRLLPPLAIVPVALTLPPLELLAGMSLIVGRPRRLGMFSALILTILFAIALGSSLARKLVIDCGCFGHGTPSRMKMWFSFGRDVLFGATLAVLYWNQFRKRAVDGKTHQPQKTVHVRQGTVS